MGRSSEPTGASLRLDEGSGRWLLAASVLGSSMVFLDSTAVNVALPPIGDDLGADVAQLQWVVSGYLLTLASFILLGGSLGDRVGRRRIFLLGIAGFAVASLLCGLAPNLTVLIAFRFVQGAAGALLAPSSLAVIQASFVVDHRGRAVGLWSGLTGLSTAVGPLLGGYLADVDWRLVFLVNLPAAVVTFLVARRHVPETRDVEVRDQPLDVAGAALVVGALGAVTLSLIQMGDGGASVGMLALLGAGLGLGVGFVVVEARAAAPLVPLELFRSRQFTGANLTTVAVYSSLGGLFFLLTLALQVGLGYSPLEAGAATLPVTVLLLVLSPLAGEAAQRWGPRLPMTVGPVVAGAGILLMGLIADGVSYATGVLPGVTLFGVGLGISVAPLTATVLAASSDRHAGVASGVNNTVARCAQLLAVALLPAVVGLGGGDLDRPSAVLDGFHTATWMTAITVAAGGVIAWFTVTEPLASAAPDAHHVPDVPDSPGRSRNAGDGD